jgi:hypothetical protein
MNANTPSWPPASYFDEGTDAGRCVLAELELVTRENWRKLYRHKADGSHWVVDEWDKCQQQFLLRVGSIEQWSTEDHTAEEKALLLNSRGGTEDGTCLWKDCSGRNVRGTVYCIDHLYEQGVRR